MAKPTKKTPKWLGATVTYEGFPLALRVRPKIDTEKNKAAFPGLVRVSHKLARVQPSGLPEVAYNETLLEFDLAIIAALECEGQGLVALIETFAGRRNYYGYLAPEAPVTNEIRSLKKRFSEHEITLKRKQDPEWGLYNKYRELFPWD